jgi:hypothetical protein
MRKLKLELDELTVQSFATDGGRGPRGTAHAHSGVLPDQDDGTVAPGDTEPGMNCFTCELSCGGRGC